MPSTRGVGDTGPRLPDARTARSSVSGLVLMANLDARLRAGLPAECHLKAGMQAAQPPGTRAANVAVPARRSAKVYRAQAGAGQRNRLAWMRNATGRPCQGRSRR